MLHDRQGSIGLYGPFAYTIAAADVAANADAAAQDRDTREPAPAARASRSSVSVSPLLDGLLAFVSAIAGPQKAQTA